MSTVSAVQRKIQSVEGFHIRFKDRRSERDVPDHMRNVPQYPYERMAKNSWTVAGWKSLRFNRTYPGFRVDVLYSDGRICDGHCLLATLRDTYLD